MNIRLEGKTSEDISATLINVAIYGILYNPSWLIIIGDKKS
jgi:hypothetical protein